MKKIILSLTLFSVFSFNAINAFSICSPVSSGGYNCNSIWDWIGCMATTYGNCTYTGLLSSPTNGSTGYNSSALLSASRTTIQQQFSQCVNTTTKALNTTCANSVATKLYPIKK